MHTRQTRKRAISAVLLATLSFGTAIGLGGCAPQENTPAPTPTPSQTITAPALPTNEEALAIVEELYPRLLESQGAFMRGELGLSELQRVATADMVATIQESRASGEAEGYVVTGSPTADTISVQQVQEALGVVEISFYACFDRSSYIPLDAVGQPVLSSDAKIRIPVEAVVDGSEGTYKVDGYTPWAGDEFC